MKAFKGCINKDCRAYKRTRFKDRDKYCTECGGKLEYVCADCWTPLKKNKDRYCDECNERKNSKKIKAEKAIKDAGNKAADLSKKATVAIPAAAKAIRNVKPDANELVNEGKQLAKAGKKAAKAGQKAAKAGRGVLTKGLAVSLRAGKKVGKSLGKAVSKKK